MRIALRLGSSFLCAAVAVGCGGGSKSTPGATAPATAVVGKSGGAVSSMDGNVGVTIPAGALGTDVMITVAPAEAPASGAVGTVYEIGPTGTQFAMPVALKLHYDPAGLGGMPETSLRVATFAAGSWQLLPGAVVDTAAKTVSGLTMHLSPYAIVSASAGQTCAQIQGAPQCAPVTAARRLRRALHGWRHGSGRIWGGQRDQGRRLARDVHGANLRRRLERLRGVSRRRAGRLHRQRQRLLRRLLFSVRGTDLLRHLGCWRSLRHRRSQRRNGRTQWQHREHRDRRDGRDHGDRRGSSAGRATCPAPPTCATAATACAAFPGAKLQNCVDGTTGYTGACCSTRAARSASRPARREAAPPAESCPPPPRCADGNPCAAYAGASVAILHRHV